MGADDQHFPVGVALDECAARLRALLLVHVEVAVHLRVGELDRVMHHVAGDDGFLAARANVHADVAGRVARRRLEPHLVGDGVIRLDRARAGWPRRSGRPNRPGDRSCGSRPFRAGAASGRIPSCRTDSAPAGRSAPTCRRPCGCSSPRGRSADASTSRCRCSRAESRRRRGPRETSSACCRTPEIRAAGRCRCRCRSSRACRAIGARSTGRRSASGPRGSRSAARATGTSARTRACRPAAASRCRPPRC